MRHISRLIDQFVGRTMSVVHVLMPAGLLAASSCYATLGIAHNLTVADCLRPGMSSDECLDVLAQGGAISARRDLQLEPGDARAAVLADAAAFVALERIEHASGLSVTRAVVIDRHWGAAGFGVFYLFLGEDGRLLGYHLEHVN